MRNIQEHPTTYQEQTKNIQETTRNMLNFSKNWKMSQYFEFLGMVLEVFLTVGQMLNSDKSAGSQWNNNRQSKNNLNFFVQIFPAMCFDVFQ